jgi:hypothetical protein
VNEAIMIVSWESVCVRIDVLPSLKLIGFIWADA